VVARLGGADEVVVRAVEGGHHALKQRCHLLDETGGRLALLLRRLLDLLAVLVGAGEEQNVIAVEPLEAGQRIGGERLVGLADVRGAIGIGDGRRYEERLVGHRTCVFCG
jgi:hypothetical protein